MFEHFAHTIAFLLMKVPYLIVDYLSSYIFLEELNLLASLST